jgi:hypothetical protein
MVFLRPCSTRGLIRSTSCGFILSCGNISAPSLELELRFFVRVGWMTLMSATKRRLHLAGFPEAIQLSPVFHDADRHLLISIKS